MSARVATCPMRRARPAPAPIRRWSPTGISRRAAMPVQLVVNGRRGMPPFGDMMNDGQVAAVVNYVRTHFGNNYQDAVTAKDVKRRSPLKASIETGGNNMKFARMLMLSGDSGRRLDDRAGRNRQASDSQFDIPDRAGRAGHRQRHDLLCQRPGAARRQQGCRSGECRRPMATPRPRPSACSTGSRGFWKGSASPWATWSRCRCSWCTTRAAPMDFKAFMEGYTQFFGGSQPNLPARSVVGVAALANPGFLVEIEVIAVKDAK